LTAAIAKILRIISVVNLDFSLGISNIMYIMYITTDVYESMEY